MLLIAAGAIISPAQTLATLANFTTAGGYNFPGGPREDGSIVGSPLIQAADGNLYGTTNVGGGTGNLGTVFKITPGGTLTLLYSFSTAEETNDPTSNGASPQTGVVQGSDGNLYGTTFGDNGYGTVFRITTGGVLTTLYVFNVTSGLVDGAFPNGLVQASDGNFYGTTAGSNPPVDNGTIFRITPGGSFTVIQTLCAQSGCGLGLNGPMVQGADGNLYGETNGGGDASYGTIFKVSLGGGFATLHSFSRSDGSSPFGGLVLGKDGNFYGTTSGGGANQSGTVFKITPAGTLTTLHSFNGGTDGDSPESGVIQASDGNFYGTTVAGGANGTGTIFEVTAQGVFTMLYSFAKNSTYLSAGALVQGNDGKFYGTTISGGTGNVGTVFRFTPATPVLPAPSISSGGVVPVYSSATTIQQGEWVSIFGSNLASTTATWTGNFPTLLGDSSVTVNGKSAYLWYVSPTQINLQAPTDAATGTVPVVVTTSGGTATSTVTLSSVAPSFSLLDAKHATGIIPRANGTGAYGGGTYDIIGPTGTSLGYPTVAAKAGDTVELFGVGFGPTSPQVSAGQVYSGAAPTTNSVALLVNNVRVTPSFAGLSSAGLYQINVTIPAGLGTGDVPLQAIVSGSQTQSGVVISLQ